MCCYPTPFIAHRGGGIFAPENTLAALQCGVRYGFRAVEFDVMLSSDGVPVLMHDVVLGRTVQGEGKVADYTANALQQYDAGSWFSPAFAGERVPLLREAMAFCAAQGVWMNIEIKPTPGEQVRTGQVVAQQVAEHLDIATHFPAVLSSFSTAALTAARSVAPDIPRALLVEAVPDNWQERVQAVGAVALHVAHQHLTQAIAQQITEQGVALMCYTVNDLERAKLLFSWGVKAICTDQLDVFALS